jgi:hypothetical protein
MQSYSVRSFAYGKLSKRFASRTDSIFYGQGCEEIENAFSLPIGPSEKRPGTIYAATGKTAGKKVRFIPWIQDPNTGVVIELGEGYMRFYKLGVRLESPPGTPVEPTYTATCPWLEAELNDVRFAQADIYMYLVHPSYPPRKLTWTSDTSWAITTPTFIGDTTFSTSGNYPSHVEFFEDRLIFARTNNNPSTFWGSKTSQYENFNLRNSYSAAAATMTPIASPGVVNWPSHGMSANNTVMFTTTGALPTGLTAGVAYYIMAVGLTANSFQLSLTAGAVAINFTGATSGTHTVYATPALATDGWQKRPRVQQNAQILWLLAEDVLLFGSSEGPFRVIGKEGALTGDAAWWPTRQASVGSSNVQAILVDDFAAFVGKGGKRIFRFQYSDSVDKYVPDDITYIAEDITSEGVIMIAHQREPTTVLWAITSDGKLLAGSYSRATNTIGWSEMDLDGDVESIAVIPTTTEDQVWLSVKRTINSVVVRHIEYLAPRNWTLMRDYHGVDAGVVLDGGAEVAVTSVTNANPAVCTTPTAHGFSNDWLVRFENVGGDVGDIINGEVYTVKSVSTYTFQLYTTDGSAAIDLSGESAPGTGGTVERVFNTVTGLTHLEGETVITLGDASVIAEEVVVSGSITLDEYANKIRTGLPFTSIMQPMPISEARNHLKTVRKVYAQFYRTGDAQVGDGLHPDKQITFEGAPTMDEEPTEFTGGLKELFDGFTGYEGTVRIESSQPLPQTVLAMIYELTVGS